MSESNQEKLLAKFPIKVRLPISWGDQDVYGHVNNTRYFRFFEDARLKYWETLKITENDAPRTLAVIVASTSCKFRAPLTYPDDIVVGARVTNVDDTRFTMEFRIVSEKSNRLVANGDALMVAFDLADQQTVNLPEIIKRRMLLLERDAGNRVEESSVPQD
jgi:acyl-CoA thioester hydrolase